MLIQKNETVEAMQGYLMQSIKAELEEIYALNMRRQNMPKYNIFNEQFKRPYSNQEDFKTLG